MNKVKDELKIDDYLKLIKEDKNLNMSYVSLSQYINLLEQALNEIREYVYQHEYCRFGHIDGSEADEIYKKIDKVLGGEE